MKKRAKKNEPTAPARVRRFVAGVLRDVAAELDAHRPQSWPDTPDDERSANGAANDAIDVFQRALTSVADTITRKKTAS